VPHSELFQGVSLLEVQDLVVGKCITCMPTISVNARHTDNGRSSGVIENKLEVGCVLC
jgi:hypothetical protein